MNKIITFVLLTILTLPAFGLNCNDECQELVLKVYNDETMPNIEQKAYILATAYYETGGVMVPIREIRQIRVDTERGRAVYALQEAYWGYGYYGRGYVQITFKDVYKQVGDAIEVDLLANPDLALNYDVAYSILVIGMIEGLFTYRRLDYYVNDDITDYIGARAVVNGTDQAEKIANYAIEFERILKDVLTKKKSGKKKPGIGEISTTKQTKCNRDETSNDNIDTDDELEDFEIDSDGVIVKEK